MKSQKLTAGIDVSKDTLDIYFNDAKGKEGYLKVSNDPKGHEQVILKLGIKRTFVMESSGPYYLKLAFLLKTSGADVRVENPIVVKRFIQMNLERNKTDKKDARWLFRFGTEREGSVWRLPLKAQLQCAQTLACIDLYMRKLTQVKNQLYNLDQMPMK